MPPISLEDVRRCAGKLCPLPSMARRETLPAGRVSLAGDKHQRYMFLCRLSRGAGHPASESETCFRTNDAHRTGPSKSEQFPSVIVMDIIYRQLGYHWI